MLPFILMVFALVIFVIGSFPATAAGTRINLVSLGLAFAAAAFLAGALPLH